MSRVVLAAAGGIALSATGLYSLHRASGIKAPVYDKASGRSAREAGARAGDAASMLLAAAPLALLGAGAVSGNPLLVAAGLA